jgi:hypothetical protein
MNRKLFGVWLQVANYNKRIIVVEGLLAGRQSGKSDRFLECWLATRNTSDDTA